MLTQRSLLHSSPRWFSSLHSSMSAVGARVRASLSVQSRPAGASAPPPLRPKSCSPTQREREASSWKPPGHSHTAPPGRGTHRPLTQRHSSESSSELSSSVAAEGIWALTSAPLRTASQRPPPTVCPQAVLTSRGLSQQQGARVPKRIAFALRWALGPCWGKGWSATSVCPRAPTHHPAPAPAMPTGAVGRTRAALRAPAAALAAAAVVEGECGPGQGSRAHAILPAPAPAHVAPLRGPLCGGDWASGKTPRRGPTARSSSPAWRPQTRGSARPTGPWSRPHRPGSRGAGSRGRRARAPRAGDTRSGRSPAG